MKITDLKVVYICPNHNEKYQTRKVYMDTLLAANGFKDVVHYTSGSESYPNCLSLATINILKMNMDNPVLIIEDDVEIKNMDDFDFPPEADAIYFGLSKWAGHKTENHFKGRSIFEKYSKNQVRIINMLSTHAILYISRSYKEAIINNMNEAIITNSYNDIMMSRIQHKFQVLANTVPTFYQSLKFNQGQMDPYDNIQLSTKIAVDPDTLIVRQI
jgi:hypothetical protein